MEPQPIESAPIEAFNNANWFSAHSPRLLLWNGHYWHIGEYGYTERGKGRWQINGRTANPTHFLPLPPDGPKK